MAPPPPTADYYAVLEIRITATSDAITKSYRRLALLRHPDRNPGDKDATAKFQLLQNAYETLSSPRRRQTYDLQHFHQHRPNPTHCRASDFARYAADARTARISRLETLRAKKLAALLSQRDDLRLAIHTLHRQNKSLNTELHLLDTLDRDDDTTTARLEKESRDPRNWIWTMSGAAKRSRSDEEERRATERRHRAAGRAVREKEVEAKRGEMSVLRDKLGMVERKVAEVRGMTLEEMERAEKAEVEKKKGEERERKRREEEDLGRKEKEGEEKRRRNEEMVKQEAELEKVRRVKEEMDRRNEEGVERARRERMEKAERLAGERGDTTTEKEENEEEQFWDAEFWQEQHHQPPSHQQEEQIPNTFTHNTNQQEFGRNGRGDGCEHDAGWQKLWLEHRCHDCLIQSLQTIFECPRCGMRVCVRCKRKLEDGNRMQEGFGEQSNMFSGACRGNFSVF